MVGSIVFVIQMAFDEQVQVICHRLVNGRVLSRVVECPVSRRPSRETTVEVVGLEEIDQVAGVFNESRSDIVVAPHWMVSVEITGNNNARRALLILCGAYNRVLYRREGW